MPERGGLSAARASGRARVGGPRTVDRILRRDRVAADLPVGELLELENVIGDHSFSQPLRPGGALWSQPMEDGDNGTTTSTHGS